MTALVVRGDARHLPLKDGTIDLLIMSPPFWNLRDYGTPGQIGNEATREAFLQQLWQVTNECKRVMKPTASMFVELGDSYTDKSLNLAPQRYAIGCVDQLGLILRAEIIWNRPNGLPESVTDRVRVSHSRWFHFTRSLRYFAALDELREPQATIGELHGNKTGGRNGHPTWLDTPKRALDPLGKLPGSVWTIGESIWDGPINFCPRCGRSLTGAGNGRAGEIEKITVSSGSPMSATDALTDSPTSSTSAPSLLDSPSTISAGAAGVSTRPTLSPSPSARTSTEATLQQPGTPPRPTASTGTNLPPPTRTRVEVVSESVGCACETACVSDGPGSVWSVPSEPLRLPPWIDTAHYAAFPTEWPRRLILGFSPSGICRVCEQGRFPIVDRSEKVLTRPRGAAMVGERMREAQPRVRSDIGDVHTVATIVGYGCGCTPYTDHPGTGERHRNSGPTGRNGDYDVENRIGDLGSAERVGPWREYHLAGWIPPPTHPAIILDPFGGTGTVAHVAHALGRHAISIDLSEAYCRLATDRTLAQWRAAKVAGRVNLERQGSLL